LPRAFEKRQKSYRGDFAVLTVEEIQRVGDEATAFRWEQPVRDVDRIDSTGDV